MDSAGKIGLRRAFLAISAMKSRSRGITSNTWIDLSTLPGRAKTSISCTPTHDYGGSTAQVGASEQQYCKGFACKCDTSTNYQWLPLPDGTFQKNNCHIFKKRSDFCTVSHGYSCTSIFFCSHYPRGTHRPAIMQL